MNTIIKINAHMFNLLIENKMDDFSVIELRDALLSLDVSFTDKEGTRQYIYRQILSFEKNGWLTSLGKRRDKRYSITDKFRAQSFAPKSDEKVKSPNCVGNIIGILVQEKKEYEAELAITLGEVEEYQSLLNRFPYDEEILIPLFDAAKERSAKLLGKVNALTNRLEVKNSKVSLC
ncbi:hypothetical protein L4D04_20390 [Photobacterium angustum]|uniref:hypothetical protein n=1 Tax=Photobacterium angustum TaxID=661 RepID=UPI003D122550